jgi:hypothetical protein
MSTLTTRVHEVYRIILRPSICRILSRGHKVQLLYYITTVRLIIEQIQLVRNHVVLQDMFGIEKVLV